MFSSTIIVKDHDKEYVYRGSMYIYRIAFDGKGSWSFNDDFVRNIIIFGVDNSSYNSSFHVIIVHFSFLILGQIDTFGINGSFGASETKFSINFTKGKIKFCSSLLYNIDNSYLFVNGKEIYKFNASNKNVNFTSQICL